MYDTLIIGGGIAGLTVAKGLAERGEKVLLLDKWGKMGGRIYTHRVKDEPVYEIGAGRIFKDHDNVNTLVRRYRLEKIPITTESLWEGKDYNGFNIIFSPIKAVLGTLAPEILATHTIRQLLPRELTHLLSMFPYRSEFDLLRADAALKLFDPSETMGARGEDYYTVKGGLDLIVNGLVKEVETAGAILKNEYVVKDVYRVGSHFEVVADHKTTRHTFRAKKVIFATCRCSLSEFKILEKAPILKQTGTAPLTRIYAVYPPNPLTGKAWFDGLKKVVTTNPLRYVIPISAKSGLIMISYTDGKDTEYWKDLKDDALQREIQRCVRELFPDRYIPEPTYLKQHRWGGACTYWLPGNYDIDTAIKAAMNPSEGVYIVGESISKEQCWIESALISATALLKILR